MSPAPVASSRIKIPAQATDGEANLERRLGSPHHYAGTTQRASTGASCAPSGTLQANSHDRHGGRLATIFRKLDARGPRSERAHETLLQANAPCAMVPLKPNELKRDVRRPPAPPPSQVARAVASTGMRNHDRLDDTIDNKWAFNLRASTCLASFAQG